MKLLKSTLLSVLMLGTTLNAQAQADDYMTLSGGYYDALRHKYPAALFGAEYRFSPIEYGIGPIAGAFITTKGGAYGYGGFNWTVPLLTDQLYIVPNFAVGAYSDGNGRQLGGPLEFRSGIELDYQFPNAHRLGIALNHISNASIYKHNPGEENVIGTYSIPVSSIVGWVSR